MEAPMSEPAKVFEDRETPDQWRVEWFDGDGRCELEIFSGPTARRQELRYAMQKYGHFKEVQLETSQPAEPAASNSASCQAS
jgi:hypothetical protein